MASWVAAEMAGCALGDVRLDRRLERLLGQVGEHVGESLPAACGSHAETLAAYRFLANRRTTAAGVLAPHRAATRARLAGEPVVLLVQDSTELDFTGRRGTAGLGRLNWPQRQGLWCHLTLAVTPARQCLGSVAAAFWTPAAGVPVNATRKRRTVADKQSGRWVAGYADACALAAGAPGTQVISVADREGDIYEWFVAAAAGPRERRADWIIRACQDRRLAPAAATAGKLWAAAGQAPSLGEVRWTLPARPGRREREVQQELRATAVTLQPPFRRGQRLPAVTVNAVLAQEVNAPAGVAPVSWLLLTSLPVGDMAAAQRVVDYYRCRWPIEVFFRVWKTGCAVEALQLRTAARLEAALALYLIVAWRVLTVSQSARVQPEAPCTVLFGETEWRALYALARRPAPATPPPLGKFVRRLAGLGGHLGRKGDGPPGPKSIWIGLQQLHWCCLAWEAFAASAPKCV